MAMRALKSLDPTRSGCLFLGWSLLVLLIFAGAVVQGRPAKINVLRIGTAGSMAPEGGGRNEKGALKTLRRFIKDETGLKNEILRQKDWRELADKMAQGKLRVGVFQGYEFAWAQEKYPKLKPLALAVNVYRYPVAYVVVRKAIPAKDFAGLQGQSLALTKTNERFLRLFLDRQCQAHGKKTEEFFSKITSRDDFEDALDDVVDGVVLVTVADRATLEAYKQRKPGRFRQLKTVAQSQPFPRAVVVYYKGVLDKATLRRFRTGLLKAGKKERGRTTLTLFRLTGFEPVAADFEQVLARTRKAYPPPAQSGRPR
jgi:ABC-type phosphate/phosphonate transport system substrate-binding protein